MSGRQARPCPSIACDHFLQQDKYQQLGTISQFKQPRCLSLVVDEAKIPALHRLPRLAVTQTPRSTRRIRKIRNTTKTRLIMANLHKATSQRSQHWALWVHWVHPSSILGSNRPNICLLTVLHLQEIASL